MNKSKLFILSIISISITSLSSAMDKNLLTIVTFNQQYKHNSKTEFSRILTAFNNNATNLKQEILQNNLVNNYEINDKMQLALDNMEHQLNKLATFLSDNCYTTNLCPDPNNKPIRLRYIETVQDKITVSKVESITIQELELLQENINRIADFTTHSNQQTNLFNNHCFPDLCLDSNELDQETQTLLTDIEIQQEKEVISKDTISTDVSIEIADIENTITDMDELDINSDDELDAETLLLIAEIKQRNTFDGKELVKSIIQQKKYNKQDAMGKTTTKCNDIILVAMIAAGIVYYGIFV